MKPKLMDLGVLFMSFMVISSDIFNDTILSCIDGTMAMNGVTFFGAIIQGIMLIVSYAVLTLK